MRHWLAGATLCVVIAAISAKSLTPEDENIVDKIQDELISLKEEMKDLQQILSRLVVALYGEVEQSEDEHVIAKRHVGIHDNNNETVTDILAKIPIEALSDLRGRDGRDGGNGLDGIPGAAGRDGRDGMPGRDGEDGADGMPGKDGKEGIDAAKVGAVYTRWGRTTCGRDSTLIYEGFAAGSHFDHIGGGVNYQCLPLTPDYKTYSVSEARWLGSLISGAEYESKDYGIFQDSTDNQNVPCARCLTDNKSAVMMLPAKITCPDGWSKEYEGYLMTAYFGHRHPTTFECMDADPEYVAGHSADRNGALFYFVKADCDGYATVGHCPPYNSDGELTCVVCSR